MFAYDAKYHRSCYSRYISPRNINADRGKAEAQKSLTDFDKGVLRLSKEIECTILSRSRNLVTLSSLHERFIEMLNEGRPDTPDTSTEPSEYPSWKLKEKLKNHFNDKLLFIAQPGKSDLVCSSEVSVGDALKKVAALNIQISESGECEYTTSEDTGELDNAVILHQAAGILRSSMSGISFQTTHYTPSGDLNMQQCKNFVPETLYDFITWCTSKECFDKANHCGAGNADLRVLGICHNIIALSCNTQTPITFGLGVEMHHNHGSKELIELLSSVGHSINYDDIRKFLPSAALDELSGPSSQPIPRGISNFNLEDIRSIVDAAIDNFDRNEETIDGKHTTHAMAIVLYQRSQDTDELASIPRTKQKSLDPGQYEEQPIQVYRKPAKKPEPAVSCQQGQFENDSSMVLKKDLVWEVARACGGDDSPIPAWSGFNALVSTRTVPVTKIRYLPFINASPSDLSTIFTTLLRLVQIAKELGQHHILITADLAIYSKAQQILWSRPEPLVGKVTMRLGGMHLTMAFLASIGKIFGDGGLQNILTSSDVYAAATASQMLQGKQYARGIRGVRLAHEALSHMFLTSAETYATKNNLPWLTDETKQVIRDLEEAFKSKDATTCATACQKAEDTIPQSVLHTIDLFRKEGRQCSSTFGFWDSFLESGNILLRLLRADREANFLMHIQAITETVPYFFLAGRITYARYTPVYIAEMKQLEEQEPLMYRHMMEGGFVVRRSASRPFNCVPTDQALEQSVNREAKSQGGVVGFTLRKGALLRWLMTRHITGEYAEAFKELCNSGAKEKLHEELGKARLNKDRRDVNDMKEYLRTQCQDPFDLENVPDHLTNITTGQTVSQKVEDSMKGIPDKGKVVFDDFVKERLGDEPTKRFWEPLQKSTVSTFADMKKALPNDKDRKLIIDTEVLFRRLLAVSRSRDVDLKNVLKYELAAVPPALFHDDGTMRKTNKADLAQKLESNCPEVLAELPQIAAGISSAYIIDGMAMVQSLNENHFRTFNDLAGVVQKRTIRLLRNQTLELTSVTIVFDRYDSVPSVKTAERERRGASAAQLPSYQILGSRPVPNYRSFLKWVGNKASLANFISTYIQEHAAEHIPNGKAIILAGGFSDGKLVNAVTPSGVSSLSSLYSNHEEADTRMILHACSLAKDHDRIIVRCDDRRPCLTGLLLQQRTVK